MKKDGRIGPVPEGLIDGCGPTPLRLLQVVSQDPQGNEYVPGIEEKEC